MQFTHENNRIYSLGSDGKMIAEITFPPVGPSTVNIDHTFVAPALRGQGIADKLMHAAAEDIRSQNLRAIATCSYAIAWFHAHPEHADLLVSGQC